MSYRQRSTLLQTNKAPDVFAVNHNEVNRQRFLRLGRESLFFFAQAILGMKDLEKKPHLDLCLNLQERGEWGPWTRGLITAARGYLKSSIGSIAWPLWMGVHQMNWACRILGASHDNIKVNIFQPMQNLFLKGDRRNLLYWLYYDRIRGEFEDWNDTQLVFIAEDPLAKPSVTYKGIASDQEGWHGDAVVIDDPEGADAEKTRTVNIDAERAVDSSIPLLTDPAKHKLLVICTPWGANPLAYKLKQRPGWKVWWMPIVDGSGKPTWTQRFPQESVDLLRITTPPDIWNSQYLLKRPTEGRSILNIGALRDAMAKWKVRGRVIDYPALELDPIQLQQGKNALRVVRRQVDVTHLRTYMHVDPVHKDDDFSLRKAGLKRESKAAITIIGVSPDMHAFLLHYWTDRLDLDQQVQKAYQLYRTWCPYEVTFDPIGAQVWFKDYAAAKERSDIRYQMIESTGTVFPKRRLPNLTARLVEDKRTVRASKEALIAERLEPWIHSCTLHLFEDQDEAIAQFKGFPDDAEYVDIVDAIAQGPPVWKPPLQADVIRNQMKTQRQADFKRDSVTGYFSPYAPKQLGSGK